MFAVFFVTCLIIFATLSAVEAISKAKTNQTPIEHVVVLMMENRSLDHMLGFLKATNPDVNGCLPNEPGCSNPRDPKDPNSEVYTVDDTAVYVQVSPSHSISGTTEQIYSVSPDVADMQGFAYSYNSRTGAEASSIMKCFSPEHLPVMATLAQEYAMFDGWYASVPGPTMVNRAYSGSATSHGMGTNDDKTIALGLPQKTIFRQLEEMGLDWRIYFELVPTMLMFKDVRHKDARPRLHGLKKFYEDVANGDLPEFTWIDPSYYTLNEKNPATDQHPDHDVSLGEALIKDVYDSLRASSLWNSTALIITYDEHGGFFDHVAPPTNVPNPDGLNATDDPFDFTRLGVRIPTLVVSPWVNKGQVIHAPSNDQGQYDHTSVIATVVHKLFRPQEKFLQPQYLTNRDAWAKTFEFLFQGTTFRDDCLESAPIPADHQALYQAGVPRPIMNGTAPLTDLQVELLDLVAGVTGDKTWSHDLATKWQEKDAALFIQKKMNEYFEREVVSFRQ